MFVKQSNPKKYDGAMNASMLIAQMQQASKGLNDEIELSDISEDDDDDNEKSIDLGESDSENGNTFTEQEVGEESGSEIESDEEEEGDPRIALACISLYDALLLGKKYCPETNAFVDQETHEPTNWHVHYDFLEHEATIGRLDKGNLATFKLAKDYLDDFAALVPDFPETKLIASVIKNAVWVDLEPQTKVLSVLTFDTPTNTGDLWYHCLPCDSQINLQDIKVLWKAVNVQLLYAREAVKAVREADFEPSTNFSEAFDVLMSSKAYLRIAANASGHVEDIEKRLGALDKCLKASRREQA